MIRGDALEANIRLCGRLLRMPDGNEPEAKAFVAHLTPPAPYDASPIARAGAARGFAFVPSDVAVPALLELARDPDLAVAGAAIESLAQHKTKTSRETLLDFLYNQDNGLKLAAVTSLGEMLDPSQLNDFARLFDDAQGDGATEIRFNILRNVAKIGGERARDLLVHALAAPEPYVRKVAREELKARWPSFIAPAAEPPRAQPAKVPLAGRDFPKYAKNPWVDVATSRGTLRFELFPEEAPIHVHNFLELAKRGYYDGLIFHRVVPDFVIQGGDYRGDGNGGTTFRVEANVRELFARHQVVPADSLRHEIGPRKFVRGSLGMPRNDDVDSGGSQFFVTHRETPHLDGRYTIFGELRSGFEVLDRIEVGDTIDGVTLVDESP